MTDILAVKASARRHGNSDTILDAAIEVFEERGAEVQTVIPRQLTVSPCLSCNACMKTGDCIQDDDMQELYPRFCEVDHIVVASPIYFTSLPGHFKVFIDRFQCFWARKYVLDTAPEPERTGMFLCVGAMDRERYYRCCRTTVKTWMHVMNIKCTVDRFFPGLDEKGDVAERPEYLEQARQAAVELLEAD